MRVSVSWYQVKDFEAAKKFYGETLGLKKTFEMQGWAEFSHAEGEVAIGLSESSEPDYSAGAIVVLSVDDLERARTELTEQGVTFEGEVQEYPGVVRIATFRDPSGNRLQLAQSLISQ